jgi:type IV pilus assembly protein PilN
VIMINLLPHREERRKRRKVAFYVGLGFAGVVGLAIAGVWYLIVEQLIAGQQQRNAFLSAEIGKLDAQIKDIASLRNEIASLKARQKAVEDLQIDRNIPVHILNELVRQTPEGVYFTSIKQDGQTLGVSGIAQTQERVAEFLRNTSGDDRKDRAEKSDWLVKPELIESRAATVTGPNREQKRLFDFAVRLTVRRPQDAASAAIPTASAPPSAAVAAVSASAAARPAVVPGKT